MLDLIRAAPMLKSIENNQNLEKPLDVFPSAGL